MSHGNLYIDSRSTLAEVLTAIKKLKYPKLSALALVVCVGFLFLLFSFAEDKATPHYDNGNRAPSSAHWETDFSNNELYAYAQWHDIHF